MNLLCTLIITQEAKLDRSRRFLLHEQCQHLWAKEIRPVDLKEISLTRRLNINSNLSVL